MVTIDHQACENCMMIIANGDASGMSDAEEKACCDGMDRIQGYFVTGQEEYGFSACECEICGALAGDRYQAVLIKGR